MPHSRSRNRIRRRILRREAPSIVPVLADASHFARMRAYGSFLFEDHRSYLRQLEGLLRTLTADQIPARAALFDPVDYERYCRDRRLEPDSAATRGGYVAEVAVTGTTVPYRGQPVDRLLPELRDAHSCRVTWQAGTELLAGAGRCGRCGADIGRAATGRATRALTAVLDSVGAGTHHLVVSVSAPGTPLITALDVRRDAAGTPHAHEPAVLAFATALAAGFATGSPGGLVLRTDAAADGAPPRDTLRGWRLVPSACWLSPLTAAEVFSAYCTDPRTSGPISPEPDVDHAAGHELPHPGGELHC